MPRSDRISLISEFERIRSSRVITFFLSDRESFPPNIPGMVNQMSIEQQCSIIEQVRAIGKNKNIDLVLYTRGGATDSVWPLINILREYGTKITVFVPFRAHSAGTMVCLGADEIVMTEISELSPIDPTTVNQFNPSDPANFQIRYPISVEDVTSYFELSEKRAGIKGEAFKVEVLKELTRNVNPLALGNVERVYMQIRRLAHNLLTLHLKDTQKIDQIVKALTEEYYSHSHFIGRKEAIKLLGNWARKPQKDEEDILWRLYDTYVEALNLSKKVNLPEYMGDEPVKSIEITGGLMESTALGKCLKTSMDISQRPNLPPGVQVPMMVAPGPGLAAFRGISRVYDFSIQKTGWATIEEGE